MTLLASSHVGYCDAPAGGGAKAAMQEASNLAFLSFLETKKRVECAAADPEAAPWHDLVIDNATKRQFATTRWAKPV